MLKINLNIAFSHKAGNGAKTGTSTVSSDRKIIMLFMLITENL